MQPETERWRSLVLLVLLASMFAIAVELLLLEHTETRTQFIPVVLLGLGIVAALWVAVKPQRAAFLTFRAIMSLFLMAGVVGLYLHYRGNAEFELEMNPALKGFELFGKTMMGATPALSPGVMGQLGLIGLIYTHQHPRLRSADAQPEDI